MRNYCALLILITALVYANTFANGWTYDDVPVIVQNPDSHSLAGFFENSRPGRPMRELTYIPEYKLFGENPSGYHVQQLFWHAANGCLLMFLFVALGMEPFYAMTGAVFFLVHPLQSESVANISHRKELLALFFSLLAMNSYIRAYMAEGKNRIYILLFVAVCCLFAVLSNQTSVTLPLTFVLYDYLFREERDRILLKRPFLLLASLVFIAAYFVSRYQGLFSSEQLLTVYSKYSFVASRSFIPLWLADLKAFGFYLYNVLVPLKLAPEYHVAFSEQLFQLRAWLSAAVLVGAAYVFFANRKQNPALSFGIGCFFVFYLPISNILPVSYILADRYMYLCLPGLSLLPAFLLQRFRIRWLSVAIGACLIVLAALTVIQNSYWKDEHTLWRHAVEVNPDSTWVQETVALSYLISNQFDKARQHAKIAISLNRYNTRAYLTLAKSEDRLGNLFEAIKYYENFCSFGEAEYPEDVANVKNYLPFLRSRAQLLYSPK